VVGFFRFGRSRVVPPGKGRSRPREAGGDGSPPAGGLPGSLVPGGLYLVSVHDANRGSDPAVRSTNELH